MKTSRARIKDTIARFISEGYDWALLPELMLLAETAIKEARKISEFSIIVDQLESLEPELRGLAASHLRQPYRGMWQRREAHLGRSPDGK